MPACPCPPTHFQLRATVVGLWDCRSLFVTKLLSVLLINNTDDIILLVKPPSLTRENWVFLPSNHTSVPHKRATQVCPDTGSKKMIVSPSTGWQVFAGAWSGVDYDIWQSAEASTGNKERFLLWYLLSSKITNHAGIPSFYKTFSA